MYDEVYLIEQCKKGDLNAFEQIIRQYEKKAYYIAFRILRHHEDVEDVLQEAFLKVYKNMNNLKEAKTFPSWFYRIVTNLSIDTFRKKKRQNENEFLTDDIAKSEISANAQRSVGSSNFTEEIKIALDKLPLLQKTALVLKTVEGLSLKEIAGVQGVSEKTIGWQIFRARQKLKQMLKRDLK